MLKPKNLICSRATMAAASRVSLCWATGNLFSAHGAPTDSTAYSSNIIVFVGY